MEKRLAGNQNTSLLKIIALVFMVCDHFGKMLFPGVPEMRILGRIAFPIYCWCVVVGVVYTKSEWKYALRLLLVGLISQPLYMAALNHTWTEPNIFLTLFLGVLALWGMKEKKAFSHVWAPVAALTLAAFLRCDYGWRGVLLMLLLYGARQQKSAIAAVMVAFCLFWGTGSSVVKQFFSLPLVFLDWPHIGPIVQSFFRLQGLAIMALPFVLIPMPQKVRLNKWVGYALYPLHLAVLLGCEYLAKMH
jgi:TraX protein.